MAKNNGAFGTGNPRPTSPQPSQRDRLRALQEREERERRTRNRIMGGVGAVVALALVALVVFVVVPAVSKKSPTATGGSGTDSSNAIVVGQSSAKATIEIYQDFMCPYCGQFERAQDDDLAAMVADGSVKLVIHPMAFLDANSNGTKYSTRAANAFVTVAKAEPDKVLAFNAALYTKQPAEGSNGLTDAEIASIATSVGVSQSTADTFTKGTYNSLVATITTQAFADGVQSTPTVKINGAAFSGNLYATGTIKAAVEKALRS